MVVRMRGAWQQLLIYKTPVVSSIVMMSRSTHYARACTIYIYYKAKTNVWLATL